MENIKWFGHASFQFTDKNGNKIYYVDPFDLKGEKLEPADLVFITHAHYDHCSFEDVKRILKNDSIISAPPDCLAMIDIPNQKNPIEPNQSYEVRGFKFSTIPAYNDRPGEQISHPRENNWVGYIFELNGQKIYHAGDTDFTKEMKELKSLNLDVAMIPIGGKFTMNVEQATEAANWIAAKVTIPMHYKRLLGENYKEAEEKFKTGVTNSKVVILEELK